MQKSNLINQTLTDLQIIASKLASSLIAGERLYVKGQLGSGKTEFVRKFLRSLGYQGAVKSPSYAIADLYESEGYNVVHLDLYRLNSPHEFIDSGLQEYLQPPWVLIIEWPEMAWELLPQPTVLIEINFSHNENLRDINIYNYTDKKIEF